MIPPASERYLRWVGLLQLTRWTLQLMICEKSRLVSVIECARGGMAVAMVGEETTKSAPMHHGAMEMMPRERQGRHPMWMMLSNKQAMHRHQSKADISPNTNEPIGNCIPPAFHLASYLAAKDRSQVHEINEGGRGPSRVVMMMMLRFMCFRRVRVLADGRPFFDRAGCEGQGQCGATIPRCWLIRCYCPERQ